MHSRTCLISSALCLLNDLLLLLDKGTALTEEMVETVPAGSSTETELLPNFLTLVVSEECLQWTGYHNKTSIEKAPGVTTGEAIYRTIVFEPVLCSSV